jgi:hypothetical protein
MTLILFPIGMTSHVLIDRIMHPDEDICRDCRAGIPADLVGRDGLFNRNQPCHVVALGKNEDAV